MVSISIRKFAWVLLALPLVQCALPAPEYEKQDFVSNRELLVAQLAREGVNYYAKTRAVDAELKLRQALYLSPKTESIRLNLAIALEGAGQYDESIRMYRGLLQERPQSVRYLLGLGHVFVSAGREREAVDVYRQALDLATEAGDVEHMSSAARSLSALYFRLGNEEEALCYSLSAVAAKSKDPNEPVRHARLLVALGKYAKAVEFLTGIPADRAVGDRHAKLALAYFGMESYDQVRVALEKAPDLKTADPSGAFEITLVKAFLPEDEKTKGKDAVPAVDPSFWEKLFSIEKEAVDPAAEAVALKPLGNPLRVYWPVNLLARLTEAEEKAGRAEAG